MEKRGDRRQPDHRERGSSWSRLARSWALAVGCCVAVSVLNPVVGPAEAQTDDDSGVAATSGDRRSGDRSSGDAGSADLGETGEIDGIPLDPVEFDIDSTTDTEVLRMRFDVTYALLTASAQVQLAGQRVDEQREAHQLTVAELEIATQDLDDVEAAIGDAAIDGFMNDRSSTGGAVLAPTLDAVAGNAKSGFTTEVLLEERDRATQAKQAAEEAEREAQRALQSAERMLEANLVDQQERRDDVDAFEARAQLHEAAAERADAAAEALSEEFELRAVAGSIIVNATIEDDVDRLIADARHDGIDLGGGGFRTYEQQIALRLINCGGIRPPTAGPGTGSPGPGNPGTASPEEGPAIDPGTVDPGTVDPGTLGSAPTGSAPTTPVVDQPTVGALTAGQTVQGPSGPEANPGPAQPSAAEMQARYDYIVFHMPPSACSPPTAKPGESEHQSGLAVDFTENGSILTSASPAFAWLKEHAVDYGLLNLPSEPWHWSTTGH